MPTLTFPPYGQFARVYDESVNPGALAPSKWRPSLPTAERESSWLDWRKDTIAIIIQTLWPLWNETNKEWENPDNAKMSALTQADFLLFEHIDQSGVFGGRPSSTNAAASIPTHRAYYIDEDTAKLGDRYYYYDTTLQSQYLDVFSADIRTSIRDLAGSVSIQFKQMIQRPRAYQVAKLLGHPHRFELAATSMTSSMSSGHCFQGCLAGAGVYQLWLTRGFSPSTDQLASLGQFAVDIGDRRVFAGVHYPSDNISSWIMSMKLVPEVCEDPKVTAFLAAAIQKHSKVYEVLAASNDPAYAAAMIELDKLLNHAGS